MLELLRDAVPTLEAELAWHGATPRPPLRRPAITAGREDPPAGRQAMASASEPAIAAAKLRSGH